MPFDPPQRRDSPACDAFVLCRYDVLISIREVTYEGALSSVLCNNDAPTFLAQVPLGSSCGFDSDCRSASEHPLMYVAVSALVAAACVSHNRDIEVHCHVTAETNGAPTASQ